VVTSFSSKKGSQKVHTYHEEGYRTVVWYFKTAHFKQKKVGVIDTSYTEYSASKLVKLTPDIVEYKIGAQAPLYDLIN
jgi:hypothetical protein